MLRYIGPCRGTQDARDSPQPTQLKSGQAQKPSMRQYILLFTSVKYIIFTEQSFFEQRDFEPSSVTAFSIAGRLGSKNLELSLTPGVSEASMFELFPTRGGSAASMFEQISKRRASEASIFDHLRSQEPPKRACSTPGGSEASDFETQVARRRLVPTEPAKGSNGNVG